MLDKYVGEYKVPGSALIILTIRREGDHLTVQENKEPKQELEPESETQFFSSTATDVYRFESNDHGQVATRFFTPLVRTFGSHGNRDAVEPAGQSLPA